MVIEGEGEREDTENARVGVRNMPEEIDLNMANRGVEDMPVEN